ncbi:MAG: competence/damage-inducible protein A [Phycisphaerales bacterium]|nr:competence/damage-inducible protein A [Phycisphaerales bacterium]
MTDAHERAAVLAIGDEIVLGQKTNTNSVWLAERLASFGVMTVEHVSVEDDLERIRDAIARLARENVLVICTGGLGPTADDLARDALAAALGEPLLEDEAALADIRALLAARGRELTPAHRVQARRPASARTLPNAAGTAPGLHARVGGADVFCLPGPPAEMKPMFAAHVLPALRTPRGGAISTRLLQVCGLVESDTAQRLGGILDRSRNPTVGITVSRTIVTLRIRHRGPREDAPRALDDAERAIRERLGPLVFAVGESSLAGATLDLLLSRRQTVVAVESCTGGMIGAMFSDVPGSSGAFLGGWVTYSNAMKSREVAVPEDLIERHGAVSEPVARAMAEGGLIAGDADHALAVTGVAGPTGGSDAKPVGTVFIARSSRTDAAVETEVRRFQFPGSRDDVRERSAVTAMNMLRLRLLGVGVSPLAWQKIEPPAL